MKPGLVLWFGDFPDQVALAHRMVERFPVVAAVFEQRKGNTAKGMKLSTLVDKVLGKLFTRKLDSAWFNLFNRYRSQYPGYPDVPTLFVENINQQETIDFFQQHPASLALVSGTRLVKKGLLDLQPESGVINLHTGLSPYIKGGPNCTNWCLANREYHLIGNTIMWLDLGIDSGNLIATEPVKLTGNESFDELHHQVMEQAHELYLEAVDCILNNPDNVPNVDQKSIGEGKTFYNRMWTFSQKRRALSGFGGFRRAVTSSDFNEKRKDLKLVKLPPKHGV